MGVGGGVRLCRPGGRAAAVAAEAAQWHFSRIRPCGRCDADLGLLCLCEHEGWSRGGWRGANGYDAQCPQNHVPSA